MSSSSPFRNPRWPDAIWDVSGAFAFDRELLAFHDFCRCFLGINDVFHIVHGAPLVSPWNSGRVVNSINCNTEQINAAISSYAKRGISLFFTFSNTVLQKEHLDNDFSNQLCKAAAHYNPYKKNAVILSSDLLNEHIKSNFPALKRINSILKITKERGKGNLDLYKRYLDEFDYVMMHPDDVLDLDFIAKLPDKERLILLINEYCIRHCPIRHLHYEDLSNTALKLYASSSKVFDDLQNKNGCKDVHTLLGDESKSVLAQSDLEIQNLYDLGFRHFKLQGRGQGNATPLLTNLLHLLLKNDADNENGMHSLQQFFWDYLALCNDPSKR